MPPWDLLPQLPDRSRNSSLRRPSQSSPKDAVSQSTPPNLAGRDVRAAGQKVNWLRCVEQPLDVSMFDGTENPAADRAPARDQFLRLRAASVLNRRPLSRMNPSASFWS